jgi:hypothetical protein
MAKLATGGALSLRNWHALWPAMPSAPYYGCTGLAGCRNSNRKQPIAFATMIMVCFEHLRDPPLCHTAQRAGQEEIEKMKKLRAWPLEREPEP